MTDYFILGINIFMGFAIVIAGLMLLRIYLEKKTPTHIFLALGLNAALLAVINNSILEIANVDSQTNLLGQAITLFMVTLFAITGLVGLLEHVIISSKEKLEAVLKASSSASIDISNIATELAASASEVNASAQEINNLAHSVKMSTDDIKTIMNILTNISEQTNLLALNASIEAGRAGDIGRGFAVVADEVRKLSDNSQTSVSQSSEKVQLIISQIEKTVALINKITEKIAIASTRGEENNTGIEQISSSAEQQTASMEEVSATANRLGDLAESLKEKLTEMTFD